MAVIDRSQLLTDTKSWLPDYNVLSDTQLESLIDYVVDNQIPSDDNQYYAEALCKSLKAAGYANKAKYAVDSSGVKREQVGGVETEYFEAATKDPWDQFIKSLKDLCPLFGYTPPVSVGIFINPGDKLDPLANCRTDEDLHL